MKPDLNKIMTNKITIITKPGYFLKACTLFNALMLIGFLHFYFQPSPRDDSDEPVKNGKVSEMKVRIDYLTGCNYLESSNGSLTPRRNALGYQVGCKEALIK